MQKKTASKTTKAKPKVSSDYNGYDYKKIFWEDADRRYEDAADRMAIRRLLPKKMKKFVDVGGAYGRLANEYLDRAEQAVIFDYSKSELKQARELYGDKIKTVAGDIYEMPFKDGTFDALMLVRISHHLKDFDKAVAELYRILKPGGVAVVEIANKKTLPRMMRYLTGKTKKSPFDRSVENHTEIDKNGFYNYHPKYVEELFKKQGFTIDKVLSVSNFRSAGLKKTFGTKRLISMEKGAQKFLAPVRFAPSIYYRLIK